MIVYIEMQNFKTAKTNQTSLIFHSLQWFQMSKCIEPQQLIVNNSIHRKSQGLDM